MINFTNAGGAASGAHAGTKENKEMALKRAQLASQNRNQAADRAQKERQMMMSAQQNREAMNLKAEQMAISNQQTQQQLDQNQQKIDTDRALALQKAEMNAIQLQRFRSLFDQETQARQQQKELAQSSMASAMKMAMLNGGVVPQSAIAALNHDFQLNENNGFIGGGFDKDGSFVLDKQTRDAKTGQVTDLKQHRLPAINQLGIMRSMPGIFDEDDVKNMSYSLMKMGYRLDELGLKSGSGRALLQGKQGATGHGIMAEGGQQGAGAAAAPQIDIKTAAATIKELSALATDFDAAGDAENKAQIDGLIRDYRMALATQVKGQLGAAQPQGGGDNEPTVGEDGNLHLPGGKVVRPNQEYVNPQDSKTYIWRGGDNTNFELVGDNTAAVENAEVPVDENGNPIIEGEEELADLGDYYGDYGDMGGYGDIGSYYA